MKEGALALTSINIIKMSSVTSAELAELIRDLQAPVVRDLNAQIKWEARKEKNEKILTARRVIEEVKAEVKAEIAVLIAEREKIEAKIKALTSPKVEFCVDVDVLNAFHQFKL